MRVTCFFSLLALLVLTSGAAADPVIEVRGRMRIELERIERVDNEMVLSGLLLDEAQSEPMPGWTVALRVGSLDEQGRESFVYGAAQPVDVNGVFRFTVSQLAPTRYQIHLTAPGDTVFAAPAAIEREVDFGRRSIELRLFAPSELSADATTLALSLEAIALDRGPAASNAADASYENDVAVDLDLNGISIATLVLKEGRASTSLPLSRVQPGQELVVHGRFVGDATRGPAEASARVRLVESATLELLADRPRVSLGSEVALHGRLRFGQRAIGGLPVVVRAIAEENGRAPVIATTDSTGAFTTRVRAPQHGTHIAFEALFTETEGKPRGLPAARGVVELEASEPLATLGARPAGGALIVGCALLVALALLRLGAVLAARRAPALDVKRPIAAPRPQATLRTASDRRIAGRIYHAERNVPLEGVRIEVAIGDTILATYSKPDGSFAFAAAPDGDAKLVAEHKGFVPQTIDGRIPHRGQWSSLEVRLVPLRAELLRRYGAALAHHVPRGEQLGPRTPRELAELALRARAPIDAKALRALRVWIEVSCFGPIAPPQDSLRSVDELTARIAPSS